MCSCDHETQCDEEFVTARSEFDPSISGGTSWRTPASQRIRDQVTPEYCSPNCPSPTTPKHREIPRVVPTAPLRVLSKRPDLATGLAVARRLTYDTSSDWDDTDSPYDIDSMGDLNRQLRDAQLVSSSRRTPPERDKTYTLQRIGPPQCPPSMGRQYAPRMTRMTPCGKCLRM